MTTFKLINLFALSTLAILACSFNATPVSALSVDSSARSLGHHIVRSHNIIAKKKRSNNSRRCKQRPSSTTTTPVATHTSKTTSPQPEQTHPSSNSGSSSSGNTSNGGSSGGGNTGIGKAGLAYPESDITPLQFFKTDKPKIIYNWSAYVNPEVTKLGYIAAVMLWGQNHVDEFVRLVKPGYAKYAMGPNEPNQQGQSDMSPQAAAGLWQQYIDPLKDQGYTLISPACTNAPSGKTWMRDFFAACPQCTVNAVALHYYGTSPQDMIDYIKDMHTTFNRNIWVTEFACQDFSGRNQQCDEGQVWNFMSTVKNFMDGADYVEHYFAFGVQHNMVNVNPLNQLLGPDNKPTNLGYYYIN